MSTKVFVEALDTYEKYSIRDSELNKIPKKGEIFSVTKERLNVLLGNNVFKKSFVKLVKYMPDKESKEIKISKRKRKK